MPQVLESLEEFRRVPIKARQAIAGRPRKRTSNDRERPGGVRSRQLRPWKPRRPGTQVRPREPRPLRDGASREERAVEDAEVMGCPDVALGPPRSGGRLRHVVEPKQRVLPPLDGAVATGRRDTRETVEESGFIRQKLAPPVVPSIWIVTFGNASLDLQDERPASLHACDERGALPSRQSAFAGPHADPRKRRRCRAYELRHARAEEI